MSYLVAIIAGAIIGVIAAALTRTSEGWVANIIVGIVGSVLAKYIFGDLLGIGGVGVAGGLSLYGILWGAIGAVVLLLILRSLHLFGYGR